MRVFEGYSSGYVQFRVQMYAERSAWAIDRLMQETGATSIVVHGNSGVSVGFAALMLHDFPLVLVRKDNDNSHGSPIEGPDGHDMKSYLVLDDFVSTGRTVDRIIQKVNSLSYNDPNPPVCLGVIEYDRSHEKRMETLPSGIQVPTWGAK